MTLDAVARVALQEAGDLDGRRVLVIDDLEGALTTAVLEQTASVRAWCDDVRDVRALPDGTGLSSLDDAWLEGVDVVLWRLPSALAALEDLAGQLNLRLRPSATVIAVNRVKHMTPTQNRVLELFFANVSARLGQQKSRALVASGARGVPTRWPIRRLERGLDLTVFARGTTFNTHRLDDGTALLLEALEAGVDADSLPAPGARALDFGSGSGMLACWLARAGYATQASDSSVGAVEATRLTASFNGCAVEVHWRDGLADFAADSLDLIVTNPPFHRGAAKDSTPTLDAIADAGCVLAPGGQFWCVFNSHLPYRDALRASVGPTQIVGRDRHYTVTVSRKAG